MTVRRIALQRLASAGALALLLVPPLARPRAGHAADHGKPPADAANPARPQAPRGFAFALIGDLPYSEGDEASLLGILAATDADVLRFVLHVGDIKASREACSDLLYERRAALLARSAHPLVLLPGDNEWTDCHGWMAGRYNPIERLDALRSRFWSMPGPLGAGGEAGSEAARSALAFERQRGQPENVRWRIGRVRFVAAHVVGSHNGRTGYDGARAEFDARSARNRQWLTETLRLALRERADALVIAFHAAPDWQARGSSGFTDWIAVLRETADTFPRPILLLHGDAHRFTVDRPLHDLRGKPYAHVTRVECFGWPFSTQWVRITYDPDAPERFHVTTRDVTGPKP